LLRGVCDRRLQVIKQIGLVLIVLGLAACGAQPAGQPPQVPPAVTALIEDLKSQPVANPPAYVASYQYAGQVVYYVPPRCCDIFGNLYDAQGQLICHPDGGIAGHGDGRCPDFLSQRKNETVLWRDTRSPA
jgi:Tol biopolymer transport system component